MLLKKQKYNDGIRPLSGWGKFFHRLGRLLLLPLRRPILTLLVLLVLFLAPTFRGVKPVNVHKWYAAQIYGLYNKAQIWWGSRQPEVTPGTFKFNPEDAAPAPVVPGEFNIPAPVDESAPNILDVLRGENKGEKAPVEEDNTQKQDVSETQEEIKEFSIEDKGIRLPKNADIYAYPEDKKVYALKYLDFPHEIVGKAIVHNCNEIEINGEFIMMYGIYLHPYTAAGVNATKYLKELIENKEVKCGVVAYTDQNIATGICYYGNENINRNMVIKGYTKNVAL